MFFGRPPFFPFSRAALALRSDRTRPASRAMIGRAAARTSAVGTSYDVRHFGQVVFMRWPLYLMPGLPAGRGLWLEPGVCMLLEIRDLRSH